MIRDDYRYKGIQSLLPSSFPLFSSRCSTLHTRPEPTTIADPHATTPIHRLILIALPEFAISSCPASSVVELSCPTTRTCPDSLAVPSVDTDGRLCWSDSVTDAWGRDTPDGVRKTSDSLDPLEVEAAAGLKTMSDE